MDQSSIMVWCDIETTGLSAHHGDVPLELGLRVTDIEGKKLSERKWLVWGRGSKYSDEWKNALANMIPYVASMHKENGLLKDLDLFDKSTCSQVETEAIAWLLSCGVDEKEQPLCGSSVGSLDRPMLIEYFPKLNEFLSHRNIDISSIKELCRRLNPVLLNNILGQMPPKDDAPHRVFGDIDLSIQEYLLYCENFLIVDDGE